MNFENSQQIVASYNDSSYRSVTNTTINNYITDSFNSHHPGHNVAGGVCGLIVALFLLAAFSGAVILALMVMEVLV